MSFNEVPFSMIETPGFKTGKTDQYTAVATEMALVHNCITRSINGVYRHALTVQPKEYKIFCQYALAGWEALHAHHTGEEEIAFPAIEKATGKSGLMEVNVAQHEAFHDGLEAYKDYLTATIASPSTFSGTHLRTLIDAFAPALSQHLNDEIGTLLDLAVYGDDLDLHGIVEQEAQQIMASLSKTTVLPCFLLNHDKNYEGGIHNFPPIPPPVKWFLMRVCTLWNWRWWRFATCDTRGNLKA